MSQEQSEIVVESVAPEWRPGPNCDSCGEPFQPSANEEESVVFCARCALDDYDDLQEVRARLQDLQGNIVPDLHSRIESRDARIRDLEGKQGRERLPDDRQGLTHRFVIKSSDEVSKGYLTVGLYPDGRVGEVFLKMDKQGGTVSGFCDAWAIAISLLLQTGTPLETIVAKYRGARFEPSGLTETPDIRSCSSPVDYAVRYLEQRFLAKASAA